MLKKIAISALLAGSALLCALAASGGESNVYSQYKLINGCGYEFCPKKSAAETEITAATYPNNNTNDLYDAKFWQDTSISLERKIQLAEKRKQELELAEQRQIAEACMFDRPLCKKLAPELYEDLYGKPKKVSKPFALGWLPFFKK